MDLSKNKLKTATGLGSIGAVLISIFTYIDSRANSERESMKLYVDTKYELLSTQLSNIHGTLIKIDDRLYELIKQKEK